MATSAVKLPWFMVVLPIILILIYGCQDEVEDPQDCINLITNIEAPENVVVGQAVQLLSNNTGTCNAQNFRYTWTLLTKPGGSSLALSNPNAINIAIVPDAPGFYIIELAVANSSGLQASTQITIRAIDEAQNPGTPVDPGIPSTSTVLTGIEANDRVLKSRNVEGEADYILRGTYRIRGQLVIEGGTTIIAEEGAKLLVENNGALQAGRVNNTQPIVFEGMNPVAGTWCGIEINSRSLNQYLDNVIIRHTGSDECRSLRITGGPVDAGFHPLELTNVTIEKGAGVALYEASNYYLVINGLTTKEHANNAIYVEEENVFALNATCNFNEGNNSSVLVSSYYGVGLSQFDQNVLSKLSGTVTYFFFDNFVTQGNAIIIEPGVRIRFKNNKGWYHQGGSFIARGTPAATITFRSFGTGGNGWAGLELRNSANNELAFVTITNFGPRNFYNSVTRAGLILSGNSSTSIDNCIFGGGDGYGILNDEEGKITNISNTQFKSCKLGNMQLRLDNITAIKQGNEFVAGNGLANAISLRPGTLDQLTLASPEAGVGFRMLGKTTVQSALTIEAGTEVYFEPEAYFEVTENATITANGSANAPIIMSSGTSSSTWPGLLINSANTNNTLQYVNISNGGGGSVNPQNSYPSLSNKANLMVTNNGYVNMQNCTISNSATVGVLLGKEATINADFLQVNTFENNAQGPSSRPE